MLKGLVVAASVEEGWKVTLTEEGLPWTELKSRTEEGVRQALKQLCAEPWEVLCLVERDPDEQMARRMGLACMGYLNPDYPDECLSGCKMLLEGLEEVDGIFLEEVYARAWGLPVQIARTEHLIIREWTLGDLDALGDLSQEEETPFLPLEFSGSREEKVQKLQAYRDSMYGMYHFGLWAVLEKKSGRLIGCAGLGIAEYLETPEMDLGYWIAKGYRRKGYALEACRAVLAYARERLSVSAVSAYIDSENLPSLRLAEKLGFFREREFAWQNRRLCRYRSTDAAFEPPSNEKEKGPLLR